ncbi:hypothetical protein HK104_001458 [Borealophlyctis nickersoniae]|nr:hypothetical protein HK104_001458 [Borealophlyctis nickersoniae]
MTLKEETNCIATPGFAGFVPSLKYQFGLTYGNATRHILRTDPSLKQGIVQQEIARRQTHIRASRAAKAAANAAADAASKVAADAAAGAAVASGVPVGVGVTVNVDTGVNGAGGYGTGAGDEAHEWVWKERQKYATGDDRFSFPPVPGYTGFIPRSKEHFGRPYVETTNASLDDFQNMLRCKNELPPRIRAIKAHRKPAVPTTSSAGARTTTVARSHPTPPTTAAPPTKHHPHLIPAGGGFAAGNASAATLAGETGLTDWSMHQHRSAAAKPTFAYSAASSPIDDVSPYALPQQHPQKTFISGYTGFVPRLQNHFGEPYPESVRKAIDEFTVPTVPRDPYKQPYGETYKPVKKIITTRPIPGFTGFIPGSRTCYSTTFGTRADIAYENFNARDEKG